MIFNANSYFEQTAQLCLSVNFLFLALQPNTGYGLLIHEVSRSQAMHHSQ